MSTPIILENVELPCDLEWTDEHEWLPVRQQAEHATSGALLLEESAVLAGRPITLRTGGDGGSRGSGLGTGEHRQVDRVIRVEIPDVGNVDVADEDSARNLERGLQEVARAARAGRRIG